MKLFSDNTTRPALRLLPIFSGVVLLCLSILSGGGCTREECLENKTSIPMAQCFNLYNPDQAIRIDSLFIYASGGPEGESIADSTSSVSSFSLPLNPESDTTLIVLRYMQKRLQAADIRDTLRLVYSRTPYFVSSACGVSYRFLIQEATSTRRLLDSVSLPEPLVNNTLRTNVALYFAVAQNPETDTE